MTNQSLLISNAELLSRPGRPSDISISNGIIAEIGELTPSGSEVRINAKGGLLIPGLNDHHVHLISYAASLTSVQCGPPTTTSAETLAEALNNQSGTCWLRGIGFHESVHPNLDRQWLDENGPNRPIRIQHRSGRLWVLNSQGLALIQNAAAALRYHERARLNSDNGRLYDVDELLGSLTREQPPPVDVASGNLASFGITGINDMTPSNDSKTWQWFSQLQSSGSLRQKVRLSGRPELTECVNAGDQLIMGETKVHLHDSSLPDFWELVETIDNSHRVSRTVAVHCVTETELVFTLSAFRSAGTISGDRIEHASVVPPLLIEQLRELELGVVTQPNFILERGDNYLRDIPIAEHPFLYRCRSLIDANIPVAFGTDLPFGDPDPWASLKAATNRQTASGNCLGESECISPEIALNGYLGDLSHPFESRSIKPGEPADCCLLDVPWEVLKADLHSSHVTLTTRDGDVIYSRN